MTRLVALLVCTAPAVFAAAQEATARRVVSQDTNVGLLREIGGVARRLGKGDYGSDYSGDDSKDGTPKTSTSDSSDGSDDMSSDGGTSSEGEDGTYEHVGCFMDSTTDRILGHLLKSPMMTPSMCHEHCNTRGAAYMATQYGHECWCSRSGLLDYEKHGVGKCDIYCEGDETETCGGKGAFDLYKLDWPAESTDPEYMDCYADKKGDRVMKHMITADDMTSAVCRDHCMGKKAMYYGTQFGSECWCGASEKFEDYERHGMGACHMACSGDPEVACGGRDSFSLFRFMGDMPDEIPATPSPSHPCPTDSSMDTSDDKETPAPSTLAEPPAPSTPRETSAPVDSPTAPPTAKEEPAPTPKTTPSPTAKETPTPDDGPSPPPPGGGGGGNYADLLELHNEARCIHGAAPLSWSSTVESQAKTYASELASSKCGQLVHSQGSGFGENLFMCWSGGGGGCYNAQGAMEGLYDSEVKGGSVGSYGGHATQILWEDTTHLGCALDTCSQGGQSYEVLVCNYDPPGNYMGDLENQVKPPAKSASECGYP